MDVLLRFTTFCQQGLHAFASVPASLPLSLFLAGLAGSLMHCTGMCGPFVLAQVTSDARQRPADAYGEWQRLAGAALLPYHAGRLTTYAALGAAAGSVTALFVATSGFAWISAILLAVAAGLLIAQALGLAFGKDSPLSGPLTRLAAPLFLAHRLSGRFALGLVLGLLPCGLVYGALAAAAGTGHALDAALSMTAFGAGTAPALVSVGWLGMVLRRRLQATARWVAAPLLVANATVMLALASQRL